MDVKWFEGEQVSAAIENIDELEESDEEVISDSDCDQTYYEGYKVFVIIESIFR